MGGISNSMNQQNLKSVGIVIPLYNEGSILMTFHEQLRKTLDKLPYTIKIYYIDDGSCDTTPEVLEKLTQEDPRVNVLTLSRNFGHQAALTCGLDHAEGDIVITMDGDGQNPPELIPEMIALYQSGNDIVIAQRQSEDNVSLFKRLTSQFFYRLINRIGNMNIPPNAADFRLLSRPVIESIKAMPEYHRFLRGMVSWAGYKTTLLPFVPQPRLGGESKYSPQKMFKLAEDAIFSFSLVPLRIGLGIGGLFYLLAIIEAIYVLHLWFTGQQSQLEPGWSSLMFMLLIVGGTLTLVISIVGIYVGYIFQEVKNRPVYLIKKSIIKNNSQS
jgi:dolichol-phosphate mannosyltransferase